MKRSVLLKKSLGLILTVALLLSMLPLSMISASAAGKELSGSLSVTIPEMKVGEKPWTDIAHPESISEGIYVSDIYWIDKGVTGKGYHKMDSDSVFEGGHIYACHISVKTLSGYIIKDVEYRDDYNNRRWTNSTKIFVNGREQDSENNGEDIYPVKDAYGDEATVTFAMLYESVLSVSVSLDDPFANAAPDFTPEEKDPEKYSAYTPTDISGYTNGVFWWDDTSNIVHSADKPFVEGHSYQATVCLKANDGYKFDGIGSNKLPIAYIGVNGCTVTRYSGSDEGDIIFITHDYGVCTKPQVRTVTIKGLDTPRPDCTPDLNVTCDGDEGYELASTKMFPAGVRWLDKTNGKYLESTDVFEEGNEYVCYLLIKPKDGYEFSTTNDGNTSTVAVSVNGINKSPAQYSVYSLSERLLITVDYPACEYGIVTEVSVKDIDIIPRPGCKPDYDATLQGSVYTYGYSYRINTESWRNGIHWSDFTENDRRMDPDTETFVEGHSYAVFVEIVPQTGYKLAVDENGKSTVKARISGEAASVGAYSGKNADRVISIGLYTDTCKTEEIDGVSVSGVEEPVPGYSPVFSAVSDEPSEYHIFTDFATETSNTYAIDGVSWYDRDDGRYLTPYDIFQSGHSYTCAVYLLPEMGFVFPTKTDSYGKLTIPGKLNGRSGLVRNNIGRLQSTGGVLVTYTFSADDKPVLYSFSVDDIVYPRPGNKPAYTGTPGKFTKLCTDYHSTSMFGYHDGIMWYDKTAGKRMEPDDTFIEGHVYWCGVVLETTDGCEFDFTSDDTKHIEGTIGGNSALGSSITNNDDERRLYLNATATIGVCEKYSGPVQIVSRMDISNVVMPVADVKASFTATCDTEGVYVDTSYNDEKFHNGVCWIDMTEYHALEENETFVDEHYYQLNIIVKTEEGYEFSQSGGVSNVYTYINGEHESSMHFGENDPKLIRQIYASYKCKPQEPVYNITVKGGSASLGGNTVFWSKFGELLTLQCSNTISDYFDHWECSDELVDIADTHSAVTTFTMPANDVTFTAVTNGLEPKVYNINVIGGVAFDEGYSPITSSEGLKTVRILWNAPQNKQFDHWEADDNSIDFESFNSSSTSFIMPQHDVTITAVDKDIDTTVTEYTIKVVGGVALDKNSSEITSAQFGQSVYLEWYAPQNKTFDHWEADSNSIDIDDINSSSTKFIMPAHDVTITAVEKSGDPITTYSISVTNGIAADPYFHEITSAAEGDVVRVLWNSSSEYDFSYWESTNPSVIFENPTADTTTFVMPAGSVEITAVQSKKIPEDKSCKVTFDANDGTPNTVDMTVEKDSELTLPTCMFTAPEGKTFDKWDAGAPGEKLKITADTIIYAEWKDIANTAIEKAECTIKTPKAGEHPDFAPVSSDESAYTVSIDEWYLDDGISYPDLTASDTFEAGKTYCVRIAFSEKPGYEFNGSTTVSINDREAVQVGTDIWEMKFTVAEESTVSGIYGDVDRDGTVTANDALLILRSSVGTETFTPEQIIIADVDFDSQITANDALAILRYSVGIKDAGSKVGQPIAP